jgi:phosphatidylethanolamine/phosphatidyl-N-methylethanolamine N-methyltransferase
MNESFAVRKRSRSVGANRTAGSFFRGLEGELAEHVEFLQAFLREPASIGALSPSSRALAKAMIQGCALSSADTVVEMGPGTGAFTGLIRERIGRKTTFFALELDPVHARNLNRRFSDLVVYNDSAEKMPEYLGLHGKSKVDYVVCGIPWANLPPATQQRIVDGVLASLAPDGVFTTFAYLHARWLPKARQFRRSLQTSFARVETSRIIWGNLPPAFVYRCSRARISVAAREAVLS